MELGMRTLKSFISVADLQSYTLAAGALSLSQPGVYQHVRQLEARLKTKLVEQHGKRVVLTEHGRVVYQFAKRQRHEEQDLVGYLRDDLSLQRGQIRIVAGTTAGEFILPTIAVGFQRVHPGIEIDIRIAGSTERVDDEVADRTYDLGMHSLPDTVRSVDRVPFLTDTLVAIVPADHVLATQRRPLEPEQLLAEPFVFFGPMGVRSGARDPIQALVDDWFASSGSHPKTALSVGSLEGMKRAVRDGGGTAIVSQYAVEPNDAGLRVLSLSRPPQRDFTLISRNEGWESNVVRSFREFALGMTWAEGAPRMFRRAAADGGQSASPVR